MKFGVDYYPEHWPEERWTVDAKLMKEAGIEVVRLAEFSWAKMEPEEGTYDFSWLDKAIATLGKEGIKTVLGTPTATPPIWIIEKNPEILPVNQEGIRLSFGGRHHNCQSNQVYRNHIKRFVASMAKHFSNNPDVVGWQIDNEFGNSHQQLCMCDSCRTAFHQWLQNKYTTIDNLNNTWGTTFWSQTYSSFDQIPVPLRTPNSHNPSLLLDWKRFSSDLIVDFQKHQLNIVRKECPHHFVTHNFMGFFDKTNYFDLSKDLDFISHDQYPMYFKKSIEMLSHKHSLAATLDLMRGMKQKPFWIMEQQSGPSGWETMSPTPRPGQLALWTYQSIAHGADTIVYFRWRSCLFGTEEYWHGILPHHGEPERRYEEIKQTIGELSPVMEMFKGGLPDSDVGILFSYDQEWAFQIQPHHYDLNYINHLLGYYKAFYEANIPVDMVSDEQDFMKYKLLVVPLLFLSKPDLTSKLEKYVSDGGHLILTMRSGVKNWNNTVIPKILPGDLAPIAGIKISEYDCLNDVSQSIRWFSSELFDKVEQVSKWADIITLDGAEALAFYAEDYYKDTPAITQNIYKQGITYYVGTELGNDIMKEFICYVVKKSNIQPILQTPKGVEITNRTSKNGKYIFILNHNPKPEVFYIPYNWEPVIGQRFLVDSKINLPPYGTAVFKTK
ncbi:Beta-galactosidase [Ruminiclostridium papyrosolvens DSM 2782]|uniref:Beta-galactosidase n=1 Tax=Ruminiclostridium papyrosolvens DSM 2782 TaxID=588581 RepID=F1T992_9FIRM|nr:beta-galactosidase [Ruminiclostridium papyrosolvens]EGD49074.1 Beta-galactosidase [Ruminiclostridium papyrosolvens DSM 2782]WES35554.1 beta-galactosidase [Ruminiclostridium papyrosolvens DSM 2782]